MSSHKLPKAFDAELHRTDTSAGEVAYYRAGTGAPLLLIHSINAAATAYEMKPLFDRFVGERTVYAIDLPGFGFSARSDRDYSIALYTEAIKALLAQRTWSHSLYPVSSWHALRWSHRQACARWSFCALPAS